jgi:NADH:ubiquinone oxidoreductase subunit 3 (subunit A)
MKKELTFLDSSKNKTRVRSYFYIGLIILLIIDFFIHKHVHFPWEEAPEFYAVYGFIACVVLIFVAKLLRLIVERKEDYYD